MRMNAHHVHQLYAPWDVCCAANFSACAWFAACNEQFAGIDDISLLSYAHMRILKSADGLGNLVGACITQEWL